MCICSTQTRNWHSKPSGVLLERSPIWITKQHNSDDCIVCKIYKDQKGVNRKLGNLLIDTNPLVPDIKTLGIGKHQLSVENACP